VPLAILQARMSSSRLPGKVLQPILGRPLILLALERIARAELLDGVVLATSTDSSDDLLVATVQAEGFDVRRGDLEDVLGRFLSVVDEFEPTDVVRLTGDNALTDPAVIDRVVEAHLAGGADYTSNTMPRTFPRGLDVEVVRASALRVVAESSRDADEREHVTMGVYRRPDRFSLLGVTQAPDRSALRWTVDYPEDLEFAREVYSELYEGTPAFGQDDILSLLERRPGLRRLESDVTE
jgi:spore coat polysaccharide biosynthesis protein SpsF